MQDASELSDADAAETVYDPPTYAESQREAALREASSVCAMKGSS